MALVRARTASGEAKQNAMKLAYFAAQAVLKLRKSGWGEVPSIDFPLF
jgi:hypothetical protein